MPNTKKIFLDSETGKPVYCIIRREADNYRLNDADGAFASNPTDPYVSLTEDSVIKGRYQLLESRSAWSDGKYTVAIYKQYGGSPSPVNDTIVGSGEMYISSDTEIEPKLQFDRTLDLREGNIKRTFTLAAAQIPSRNVDVGRLNYMTVIVKADNASDWSSPVSTKTLYFKYAAMGDVNPSQVGEE